VFLFWFENVVLLNSEGILESVREMDDLHVSKFPSGSQPRRPCQTQTYPMQMHTDIINTRNPHPKEETEEGK